jgi:uncharacterized NAD(P)/FAD-binding protein YdhS
MGTITLSVPDELKRRMSQVDWVDWSSVARKAFSERLRDIKELELRKKIAEISEIPEDDTREVRKELAEDVVRSIEDTIKSGKTVTLHEFNKWCEEL